MIKPRMTGPRLCESLTGWLTVIHSLTGTEGETISKLSMVELPLKVSSQMSDSATDWRDCERTYYPLPIQYFPLI